jgi:hypothetical protein
MRRETIAAFVALGLPAAFAFAQSPPDKVPDRQVADRQVALPAEDGLVVGHQARQGRAVLVELVPRGETVRRFTRMVTLQTLPGLARIPEADVLARFAARYREGCPRAASEAFGRENGFEGVRIDCPLHPRTGRMETVFARLLALDPDRAMVQITLTQVPQPADARWARDYLGRVAVR